MNEKQDSNYFQPPAQEAQPPPAYASAASPPPQANWPPLAQATALYQYTSADDGDLELQPNDQITVTEYMNAEWWKGKSSRTGKEGIFPRSYVKVIEEKGPAQQNNQHSNNYGNMPLETSQMGNGEGKVPSKGMHIVVEHGLDLRCMLTISIRSGTGQEVREEVSNPSSVLRKYCSRRSVLTTSFLGLAMRPYLVLELRLEATLSTRSFRFIFIKMAMGIDSLVFG